MSSSLFSCTPTLRHTHNNSWFLFTGKRTRGEKCIQCVLWKLTTSLLCRYDAHLSANLTPTENVSQIQFDRNVTSTRNQDHSEITNRRRRLLTYASEKNIYNYPRGCLETTGKSSEVQQSESPPVNHHSRRWTSHKRSPRMSHRQK